MNFDMNALIGLGFTLSLGAVVVGVLTQTFWVLVLSCVITWVAFSLPYWVFKINDKTRMVN